MIKGVIWGTLITALAVGLLFLVGSIAGILVAIYRIGSL